MVSIQSFATRNRLFLVYVLLITCWCSLRNQGWMIVLLAPLAVMYQLAKLGLFWKNLVKRSDRFFALAIIAVSILLVAASHLYHHLSARSTADALVADIEQFKAQQGHFPADEKESGITDLTRKRLYRVKYGYVAEKPVFSYSGTFGLFHRWEYDFSARTWNYEAE
jgi:hypothetical protein